MPAGHQFRGVLRVDGQALALPIGAAGTAHIRALVPRQSQPPQRLHELIFVLLVRPRLVGILDAQHKLPFVLSRPHPVK